MVIASLNYHICTTKLNKRILFLEGRIVKNKTEFSMAFNLQVKALRTKLSGLYFASYSLLRHKLYKYSCRKGTLLSLAQCQYYDSKICLKHSLLQSLLLPFQSFQRFSLLPRA